MPVWREHHIERKTTESSGKPLGNVKSDRKSFVEIGKQKKEDLVSMSHTVTNSSQNQSYYKNTVNTVQTPTFPTTNKQQNPTN
jgi:hypothetical protein